MWHWKCNQTWEMQPDATRTGVGGASKQDRKSTHTHNQSASERHCLHWSMADLHFHVRVVPSQKLPMHVRRSTTPDFLGLILQGRRGGHGRTRKKKKTSSNRYRIQKLYIRLIKRGQLPFEFMGLGAYTHSFDVQCFVRFLVNASSMYVVTS